MTLQFSPIADPEQLRVEQARTLATPRRRYGLNARALFMVMDVVYGRTTTLDKCRVLEIVARVPYQAWEHVAYIAVTHTHESPNRARAIHDHVVEARMQQDNEQWHLLILEELLQRQGHRHRLVRDRLLPQVLAFVYYQLSWLLYAVRPASSHHLNADFEDHAEHTYMQFVADHPELDHEVWHTDFRDDYGSHDTLGELFRQIALDERTHKQHSVDRGAERRFRARPRKLSNDNPTKDTP